MELKLYGNSFGIEKREQAVGRNRDIEGSLSLLVRNNLRR